MIVQIATDGSGTSSGPGGWAAVFRYGAGYKEISGSVPEATNNSMELMAAVMALRELKVRCEVEITSDSEYLINGAKFGLFGWQRNGWLTKSETPVKNREIWEDMAHELSKHKVTWVWTKGHTGHVDNERADVLAGEARATLLPPKEDRPAPKKRPIAIRGISPDELVEALRSLPTEDISKLRDALAAVA